MTDYLFAVRYVEPSNGRPDDLYVQAGCEVEAAHECRCIVGDTEILDVRKVEQ